MSRALVGDGRVTAAVALIGAGALFIREHRRITFSIEATAAVIVTLTAFVDLNDFTGFGLYLTLFAGIAWLVGVVMEWRAMRTAPMSG